MHFVALATRHKQITPNKVYVVLPLSLMALLNWLSSLPGIPRPEGPELYGVFYRVSPYIQNVLHVPAYAILALRWQWTLTAWVRHTRAQAILAAVIACIFGISDEWHQSFVPGRFASLSDVALDFAGAALGVWLAFRMHRWVSNSPAAVSAIRITQ